MAYNTYGTSPIRTQLNSLIATGSIIAKVAGDATLMRNISKTVNRTWVYDSSPSVPVDSNRCQHVSDRLWLLGCGNINCTGIGSGTKYLPDADYDTSKFTGRYPTAINMWVPNSERIKRKVNSDGSTSSSADNWWLRSAGSDGDGGVGCVNGTGYVDYYVASNTFGCSPALTIG